MKNLILAIASLMIAAPLAQAQDTSSGCGLGWQVSQRQSLVSSWIRASTNATFSNTIAMTFGTSGCARHDLVLNEKKAIHYAEANFDRLQIELAQGHGEYFTAFAEVLGCDSGALAAFGQLSRAHYGELFEGAADAEALLTRTRALLDASPILALRCRSMSVIAQN